MNPPQEAVPHALPLHERRRIEQHLCPACAHHVVCRVARAADPNLCIVVSQCLAFDRADDRPSRGGRQ